MRYLLIILLGVLLVSCQITSPESKEERPNIIVFLVDDLGWQDTSVPFHETITAFNRRYKTPNMERLADEGIKFVQAYATPVCSPSRISLLTGMNAARHRVTNWTLRKDTPTDRADDILNFPEWNVNGLSPEPGHPLTVHATPLPHLLASAGYHTIHVGKAHFGAIGTPGADPLHLGFKVNIAGHAAGAPGSYYGEDAFGNNDPDGQVWAVPGMEDYYNQQIYLSEALTQEAILALDERPNDSPFFLYMAHYAVHTPIQADYRFFQKYLTNGLDSTEAAYASMVEGMDKSLGDIMNYLSKNNLEENTIILFMSDNGGLSAHARGGQPNTHNRPLASGKGSLYEGGIREPMLVKWPGVTKPGTTSGQQVIIEDFFPTILEMAQVTYDTIGQQVDGVSFIPALHSDTLWNHSRFLVWHFPNQWGGTGPGIGTGSAIRQGDWKLVHFYKEGRQELFNLKEDIGETNNLITTNPEKAQELARLLTSYLENVNAQLPTIDSTGISVAYPDNSFP